MTKAQKAVILDEYNGILNRFKHAYTWFAELMRDAGRDGHHRDCAELSLRLIALPEHVLWDVFGALAEHGYNEVLPASKPLDRLEFIRFFVGHEILDDGDPALAWCVVNLQHERVGTTSWAYRLCRPDERGAQPYFHRCREVTADAWEDRAPHLTPQLAMWCIDWHEADWRERYRFHREEFGRDEQEPTANPKMIALAEELRALMPPNE